MNHTDLLQRREELKASLANATLNLAQAKRDLADARDAEQRVRGAITLIDEFLAPDLEEVMPGARLVSVQTSEVES